MFIVAELDLFKAHISYNWRQRECSRLICNRDGLIQQFKNAFGGTKGYLKLTIEHTERDKRLGQDTEVDHNGTQDADREATIQNCCAGIPEKYGDTGDAKQACTALYNALQACPLAHNTKLLPGKRVIAGNFIFLAREGLHDFRIADGFL